jgi:hypothetical protein
VALSSISAALQTRVDALMLKRAPKVQRFPLSTAAAF